MERKLYFYDPRFEMTFAGRILVRSLSSIAYLVLFAAVCNFLLSDLKWLFWLGVLLVLFLVDRAIHFWSGDKPIREVARASEVNVSQVMTRKSFGVLEGAYDKSRVKGKDFVLEVVTSLLSFFEIRDALIRLDVSPDEFLQKAEEFLNLSQRGELSDSWLESIASQSFLIAESNGHEYIYPSDVFAAIATLRIGKCEDLFIAFNISPEDLREGLFLVELTRRSRSLVFSRAHSQHRVVNRAWTSRPTPQLDRWGEDLTDAARMGTIGLLVGHKKEYGLLVDSLARSVNPNALLIGDGGIGKRAIVEHLAFALAHDDVPPSLFDRRLVSLNISELMAGGEQEALQARVQSVVNEILLAGNIILYIPNIHNLLRTSGGAYLSAADAFLPVISHNSFPVIGDTLPREMKTLIEPRSDFLGSFETIRVEEISEEEARRLLMYRVVALERESGVKISFFGLKAAVRIAKKYFHDKPLPGSAEDLLRSAAAEVAGKKGRVVTEESVVKLAEERVNVPIHATNQVEADTLLHLEEVIASKLIGQTEAVHGVSRILREYRAGLTRSGGTIANFLFVGPTGVGKTELAKVIAEVQFGSKTKIVRLDMAEYQDVASMVKLIGSPDGEIRGALTEAIRLEPYSLLLLDEFEKASSDVLNLFLSLLDEGRLADGTGRVISFENVIVVATSNAHSDIVVDATRRNEPANVIAEELKRRLTDIFKPELLNRFSEVVVFKELSREEIKLVTKLQLADVASHLLEQGISISFDDGAVQFLADKGYDPAFGVRPLRRVIEEEVRGLLAEKILKQELGRNSKAVVVLQNGHLAVVA